MNWEGLKQDLDLMKLLVKDMTLPTKARKWANDRRKQIEAILARRTEPR